MRILICGERSFAARGLPGLLATRGHQVTCFSRGPVGRIGDHVSGPVEEMHLNPHLRQRFDVVINYIVLMDQPVGPNLVFLDSLLRFLQEQSVPHLVHISSISAYGATVKLLNEDAPIESDPDKKGPYGSVKSATELYVRDRAPQSLKVSIVRPAFLLAPGLKSPIAGNAVRLPAGQLLAIGNDRSQFPLMTRDILNEAMVRIAESPPGRQVELFIVAAGNSPTRREYLEFCCTDLGSGTGVVGFSGPAWRTGVILANTLERLSGLPAPKLASRVTTQTVDPRRSERRLGMSFDFDWRPALCEAAGVRTPNFSLPYPPSTEMPSLAGNDDVTVSFIGFGRIVQTRHLQALTQLQFTGSKDAVDIRTYEAPNGTRVRNIQEGVPAQSALYIVASPGPVHVEAIPVLTGTAGPVLVEKPLAYSEEELQRWIDFSAQREAPTVVCHNYRYKRNVNQMLEHLKLYNPGKLQNVYVHFESGPVSNDPAVWMRVERDARTLLMDYSINLLDVACMFGRGAWTSSDVSYCLNDAGQTSLIEGKMTSDNYSVTFLLRQGFGPRRAHILFTFQNYSVDLGFFPDTFVPFMTDDNPWLYVQGAGEAAKGTVSKVIDKLSGHLSDNSHALVIGNTIAGRLDAVCRLDVAAIAPFYRGMFRVSSRVYGDPEG